MSDREDRPPIYPAEWLEEEAMQEEDCYSAEEVSAVAEAAERLEALVTKLSVSIDGYSNGNVSDAIGIILGSILVTADDGACEIALNEIFRTADIWRSLVLAAQSETGETRQ